MMRLSQRLILCFIGASIALLHCALAELQDKSTWMADENVQGKTLMELTVPASHDAHTYGIKKNKLKLHRAAICQKLNITEQLTFGVRALDVRLKKKRGGFGTSHGLKSINFDEVLRQIIEFLKKNKSEIVFLKLKEDTHFWKKNMKQERIIEQTKEEIESMKKELNFKELKHVRITEWEEKETVANMVAENKRLVLIFKGDVEKTYRHVKAGKGETLVRNVEEHAQNLLGGEDNREYRWLSMQVTCFFKAWMKGGGYKQKAADCAKLAGDERVSKTITKKGGAEDRRLFNFVGMDMHGEDTQEIVNYIIESNQRDGPEDEEFSETLNARIHIPEDADEIEKMINEIEQNSPKNPIEGLAQVLGISPSCDPSAPSAASATAQA